MAKVKFLRAVKRSQRRRTLKPVRPSRATELWYKAQLLGMVGAYVQAVNSKLLPMLSESDQLWTTDAGIIDRIEAMFERLNNQFSKFSELRSTKTAKKLAEKVDKDVSEGLKSSLRVSLGIDISGLLRRSAPLGRIIDNAVNTNVGLIQSIPAQYLERVKQSVYAAVSGGIRWESVKESIKQLGEVTQSRAKLIARDQVSKMNGSINRVRQQALGITQYKWSTSGDERVRESHREKDGLTFSWGDPPDDTGHPGDDYQCRCVAIAIIDYGEDDALQEIE